MDVILQVFIIFATAKVVGEVFVRLRQPAIVGELLVGVALGPHVLDWIKVNPATNGLAEIGIVVLLFVAGLETRLGELMAVGRSSVGSSLGGMTLAAGSALGLVVAFGYPLRAGSLAAVALAASSVGIAARAFSDLGAIASRPARVVFGAAVVDDVAALAALPLAQGLSDGGSVGGLLIGLGGAIGFVVLVSAVGSRVARRHAYLLELPRTGRAPFVLALTLCLGLAALAEQVGLAALVGAFVAGMVLAETREHYRLKQDMEPLFDFLVPFFFVVSGARMDPGALADAGAAFVIVLVIVTILAKLIGCALGATRVPRRERLAVALGMVPRGEVTLAVATAGLAAGQLPDEVFSALLAAVLVSTLVAPPLLKFAIPTGRPEASRPPREGPPEGPALEGEHL